MVPDFHFSYLLFLLVVFFTYGVWRSRRARKMETESNMTQQDHLFNWLELPLMDEHQFWRIMHRCSGTTPGQMSNNIAIALTHLSASDVVSFDKRFRYYENELYTTTFCAAVNFLDDQALVRTAARLIIAKGRVTYERVSEDADLIADYITYSDAHGDFNYGATKAYGDKTGDILPEPVWRSTDAIPATAEEYIDSLRTMDIEPRGDELDTKDLSQIFPRIALAVSRRQC